MFAKSPPESDPLPARCNGTVLLTFDNPLPTEVPGLLTGRDETAFRARHHCFALHPGQIVGFECVAATGRAQVVSTQLMDGYAETHFGILDSSEE